MPSLHSREAAPQLRPQRSVLRHNTVNGALNRVQAWEAGSSSNNDVSRGGARGSRLTTVKFHTIESGFPNAEEGSGSQAARLTTRSQSSFFKRPSRNPRRVRTLTDVPMVREHEVDNTGLPNVPESKSSLRESKAPEPLTKKVMPRASQDVRAPLLATKHRLKLFEVKTILEEFDKMVKNSRLDSSEDGSISPTQFMGFLCRVFEVPSVPEDTAEHAYEASKAPPDGVPSVEAFLEWYTINMFTIVNVLNGDLQQTNTNEMIYSLAKKHQVSTMVIDKVKAKFDLYDTDGSGEIEYDEFRYLLTVLLKVKSESDLSQDRIMRAWKEIDVDHSGGVDFPEFTTWYLKYLGPCDEDDMARGPAETFYDSFNPVVQRRQVLNNTYCEDDEW